MIKVLAIFLVSAFSISAAAENVPCQNHPETSPKTTQLGVLKTQLLPINLEFAQEDLVARLAHHDYRFIAIGGFGITYPGLENRELLCAHGFRFIHGTSDGLDSREHNQLVQAFTRYATTYNKLLEARLSGN